MYEKVWQAFAVLLPVRSVGVMGDGRTYGLTVAVRVVQSDDAMTADWVRLPGEVLERMSTRIVNEVAGSDSGGLRHKQQTAKHHRVGVGIAGQHQARFPQGRELVREVAKAARKRKGRMAGALRPYPSVQVGFGGGPSERSSYRLAIF